MLDERDVRAESQRGWGKGQGGGGRVPVCTKTAESRPSEFKRIVRNCLKSAAQTPLDGLARVGYYPAPFLSSFRRKLSNRPRAPFVFRQQQTFANPGSF